MTVLTFPTNPTLGQLYNAPNQIRYVYDGVKWIVETVASTSLAVTNSVQDRVAPMFVTGPHQGINFAYNAGTNVISATVTAGGNSLINGVHEFTLESNGTLSLDGDPFAITSDSLVNSASSFSVSSDGTLTLTHPPESDPIVHPLSTVLTVQKAAGNYHTISGAYGLSLQATPVPGGFGLNTNTNFVDIFHDGISVNVNNNTWAFGTDGALTLPSGEPILFGNGNSRIQAGMGFHINSEEGISLEAVDATDPLDLITHQWGFGTNGTLSYPNNALQRDTATVTCAGNASTVVYTASGQYQHTIRLLIQVEGNADGGPEGWDTQACEMIIAKSFRGPTVAATVYAVVHTSVAPLATFTAEWNALTNRVDVVCATPSANSVYVRTFATEIYTAD